MGYMERLDQCALTATVAARDLLQLYTRLQDPKQRLRAEQVHGFVEERVVRRIQHSRLALQEAAVAFQTAVASLSEDERERVAWMGAMEGLLGLSFFYRFGGSRDRELRTLANRCQKALAIGFQGFATAFPLDQVRSGVDAALQTAESRCLESIRDDLELNEAIPKEALQRLAQEVQGELLGDLRGMVDGWLDRQTG